MKNSGMSIIISKRGRGRPNLLEKNHIKTYIHKNKKMELENYLKKKNVWFRLIEKEQTVHTADAAAATGIPLERITKSLVCLADDEPIVAIIPGNRRLDTKVIAKLMNVKKVELCPFEEAHKYSGYSPGATPPVNYERVKKVFFDRILLQYETVFGGGSSRKKLLEMKPQDIVRLNNAIVEDISMEVERK